jgi:hypothetical protein
MDDAACFIMAAFWTLPVTSALPSVGGRFFELGRKDLLLRAAVSRRRNQIRLNRESLKPIMSSVSSLNKTSDTSLRLDMRGEKLREGIKFVCLLNRGGQYCWTMNPCTTISIQCIVGSQEHIAGLVRQWLRPVSNVRKRGSL